MAFISRAFDEVSQIHDRLSHPCKNEILLLVGLLNFDDLSSDGWQTAREIMRKGGFKSQINNFKNYLHDYLMLGHIEERFHKYKDSRNREHFKKQYRLSQDISTYLTLKRVFYHWAQNKNKKIFVEGTSFFNNLKNKIDKIELFNRSFFDPEFDLIADKINQAVSTIEAPTYFKNTLIDFHLHHLNELKEYIDDHISNLNKIKNKTEV